MPCLDRNSAKNSGRKKPQKHWRSIYVLIEKLLHRKTQPTLSNHCIKFKLQLSKVLSSSIPVAGSSVLLPYYYSRSNFSYWLNTLRILKSSKLAVSRFRWLAPTLWISKKLQLVCCFSGPSLEAAQPVEEELLLGVEVPALQGELRGSTWKKPQKSQLSPENLFILDLNRWTI